MLRGPLPPSLPEPSHSPLCLYTHFQHSGLEAFSQTSQPFSQRSSIKTVIRLLFSKYLFSAFSRVGGIYFPTFEHDFDREVCFSWWDLSRHKKNKDLIGVYFMRLALLFFFYCHKTFDCMVPKWEIEIKAQLAVLQNCSVNQGHPRQLTDMWRGFNDWF